MLCVTQQYGGFPSSGILISPSELLDVRPLPCSGTQTNVLFFLCRFSGSVRSGNRRTLPALVRKTLRVPVQEQQHAVTAAGEGGGRHRHVRSVTRGQWGSSGHWESLEDKGVTAEVTGGSPRVVKADGRTEAGQIRF